MASPRVSPSRRPVTPSHDDDPTSNSDVESQRPLLAHVPRPRSLSPASRHSASIRKIRTPLERILICIAIGLFIACGVLLGLYIGALKLEGRYRPLLPPNIDNGHVTPPPPINRPGPPPHNEVEFCLTPECVRMSARLLDSMDTSVDPCSDFYHYACGGWERAHDIPDSKTRIGTFNELSDANKRIIRDILQSESFFKPPTFDITDDLQQAERFLHAKTRSLYTTCLDEKNITRIGAAPLKALADQYIHYFPVNNSVSAMGIDRDRLVEVLSKQHASGIDSIVGVGVTSDDRNPTVQVVAVSQAGLGLPSKEYYEESRITEVYSRAIASMFKYLYLPSTKKDSSLKGGQFEGDDKDIRTISETIVDIFSDLPSRLTRRSMIPHSSSHRSKHRRPKIPNDPEHSPKDPLPHDPQIPPKMPSEPKRPIAEPLPGNEWDVLAMAVVEFEARLSKLWMSNVDLHDPIKTYNPMTLRELADKSQVVQWDKFLPRLALENGAKGTITANDIIIAITPNYLSKVDEVVQTTPPQVLNTYLAWRAISQYIGATDEKTQEVLAELRQIVSGIPPGSHTPREDTCLALTDSTLGLATGRWFVERAFPGTMRQAARSVISSILDAFDRRLDGIDWLDDPTRQRAKRKARALDRKVGYPDIVTNVTALVESYSDFRVEQGDHFGNIVRGTQMAVREQWGKFGKPTDYSEWGMTPATVNAYYNPSHNEIVFPAGILQPPFFSANIPDAINYGAIGVVAGHELGHAFDNNGRWYDEQGKLSDWWGNQTAVEFESRAKCFVSQYEKFSITDPEGNRVNVNGKLTLGENIADNGGVSQSWAAWRSTTGQQDDRVRMPGLPATPADQLFFLGFANVWCGKIRPEAALSQIRTDPHSPAWVRVNAAVQNSKQFASAFKCNLGSPMNPSNKCQLW